MKGIYYGEDGISISGSQYVHLSYGPVMENFDMLFGKMVSDKIARIDVIYEGFYEKRQVVPKAQIPEDVLSDSELEVLERIYNKFVDFGSVEISNYSHAEKGYSSTSQGETISYAYVEDINLI